jgi:DNA-binding phage protein
MISTKKQSFTRILEIAVDMRHQELEEIFVERAMKLAMDLEGIRDLMVLWSEETDSKERNDIIADLQEEIDEYNDAPRTVVEKPKINFDQLDTIAASIVAFKRKLREAVDAWGGINKLARETAIPQPSLSRFFNSASMPRRTTLYKIIKAVGLNDSDIVFEWMR